MTSKLGFYRESFYLSSKTRLDEVRVNKQDFLQVFQGSRIGKMDDNNRVNKGHDRGANHWNIQRTRFFDFQRDFCKKRTRFLISDRDFQRFLRSDLPSVIIVIN